MEDVSFFIIPGKHYTPTGDKNLPQCGASSSSRKWGSMNHFQGHISRVQFQLFVFVVSIDFLTEVKKIQTTVHYRLHYCHVYQQVQSIQQHNIQGFQNYYDNDSSKRGTTLC